MSTKRQLRFLWPYFRRHAGWMALALVATVVVTATTLIAYILLQPIFSDILKTDGSVGGLGFLVESKEASDSAQAPTWLQDLQARFDPKTLVETSLQGLRGRFGVDSDLENLKFLSVLFALVMLVRSLGMFVNGYFFQIIGLGGTNDLRNDLYSRILHQSSRFFAQHPSGELLSRVSSDIGVMQTAISTRLIDFAQQSLTLVGLLYLLFRMQPQLAAVCLVVTPAILYPIVRFGKSMRRTSHSSQERMADISNLVVEAVRGHRIVKAFGMEDFELTRFRAATKRHLKVRLRAQMLRYASGPVVESLAAIGAAFFLVFVGTAILEGRLRTSEMMTFLITLLALYDPVRKLNKVNLVFQEALAAADRVESVMKVANEIEDIPDAATLAPLHEAIRFENVTFAYDQQTVLEDLSLTIKRGDVIALVGASGAGKSTLVNLLPRFFDPDQGRVSLDGVDIREVTLASLRGMIGIVTQETVLFNDTVRNNIAYGRADLPLERVEDAAKAAFAHEFVQAMPDGYDTVVGEGGSKVSGGQRQRLAIARALFKDPPILILDEATSNLDSEAERLVQHALSNLMAGRTALVIAHRLSTVQRADRIVVMDAGKIVEQGTHDELLAAGGRYRRLYELQFRDHSEQADA